MLLAAFLIIIISLVSQYNYTRRNFKQNIVSTPNHPLPPAIIGFLNFSWSGFFLWTWTEQLLIKSDESYLASDTVGGQIDYWEPSVVSSHAGAEEEHRQHYWNQNIVKIQFYTSSSSYKEPGMTQFRMVRPPLESQVQSPKISKWHRVYAGYSIVALLETRSRCLVSDLLVAAAVPHADELMRL